MKLFLIALLFFISKTLYANCSYADEVELREYLNLVSKPLQFLNVDNECRFTAFAISNSTSLAVDYIAVRDASQWDKSNISSWFIRPTKSSGYRFISRDGKSIEYYDSNFNLKKLETNYKMNMKDGVEIAWFNNGNIKSQSHYKNNLSDGVEMIWNENGKKVSERYFKNGLPDNNPKQKRSSEESNQELSQIEIAKDKCKKLGLKEKTEKFGICVLEIIK